MNTGQSMFTLLAMMMLTTISTRVNENILRSDEISSNSKYALTAISLITSVVEDANRAAYDENSTAGALSNVNQLTVPARFGLDAGETDYIHFDDIDDFHEYTFSDSTMQTAVFNGWCKVEYVDENNLERFTSNRSWHKKLTVYCTSGLMKDTMQLSSIYSYWVFR